MKQTFPKRVLLLGNEDAAFALRPILNTVHAGYSHANSDEALQQSLRTGRFDLCIYDKEESLIDDYATLNECIELLVEHHVPVLLLTTSPQEDIRQFDHMPVGFFDISTPPFFPELLRRKILNLLAYSSQYAQLKEEIRRKRKAEKALQRCDTKFHHLMDRLVLKLSVLSAPRNHSVRKTRVGLEVY